MIKLLLSVVLSIIPSIIFNSNRQPLQHLTQNQNGTPLLTQVLTASRQPLQNVVQDQNDTPPFTQVIAVSRQPLENLPQDTAAYATFDYMLRARPITCIDELKEQLEDYRLTPSQQQFIQELDLYQDATIKTYKQYYLSLIEYCKNSNKFIQINDLIMQYRTNLKNIIERDKKSEIDNFMNKMQINLDDAKKFMQDMKIPDLPLEDLASSNSSSKTIIVPSIFQAQRRQREDS